MWWVRKEENKDRRGMGGREKRKLGKGGREVNGEQSGSGVRVSGRVKGTGERKKMGEGDKDPRERNKKQTKAFLVE